MKLKMILLICVFQWFGMLPISANENLNNLSSNSVEQVLSSNKNDSRGETLQNWLRQDKIPDRVSFSTHSGFVLLRKEEIIFITIDSKAGSVLLYYRKNGQVKKTLCPINLIQAFAKLPAFPFVKVSRSTIVNMNAVEMFEGTRRDAHLLMDDGSKIKVSRNMAGVIHDWLGEIAK